MFGLEKLFSKKQNKIETNKPKGRRGYAAAAYNSYLQSWLAGLTTADAEIRTSFKTLVARSRQLGRDNGYFINFLRETCVNVVERGIGFQAQVRKERGGELDESVNSQIENEFAIWSRSDSVTVHGEHSFNFLQRVLLWETGEAGEVFIRFIYQRFGRSKVPLSLEIIEAENLDVDYNGKYGNNEIRMGVEYNEWGRVVAYHFYGPTNLQDIHPQRRPRIRVPKDEVVHLKLPTRVKQTRGVPWGYAALIEMHHLGGYKESELMGARAAASTMGFIESPEGELIGDGDDEAEYDRVKDFAPLQFAYLGPGEKPHVLGANKPNSNFDPFSKFILKSMSAGLGISFHTLSKDFSEGSYSSTRQALLAERDHWKVLQAWFLECFCQPVFEKWLEMAVLSGVLKLKGYEANPTRYESVKWLPRGWAWIDPTKEITAAKEALKAGLSSKAEIINQSGGDFEEVTLQIKREREFEKQHEIGRASCRERV